jgi:adenylate cyclase
VFEPRASSDLWATTDAAQRDELAQWQAALQHYRAQDWDAADATLAALMERYPECGLYAVYRQRIAALRGALLPSDWDGVNTFDTK